MKNLLILIFIFAGLKSNAQSLTPYVISSAGEHFVNGGIQLSFTLGEPVIETIGTGTTSLTQGFHQPFSTSVSVQEISPVYIHVYPNPTSDLLFFESEMRITTVSFYNTGGQKIPVTYSGNSINVGVIISGVYILELELADGSRQFFRIIKT